MPEKICVFCREDCSSKPRIKDEQGRYACKSCASSRAASTRKPEPRAVASAAVKDAMDNGDFGLEPFDDGLDMDQFLQGATVADSNPCPGCGSPRSTGAVVCMTCGLNSATGDKLSTAFVKEKVRKQRSAPVIRAAWLLPGLALLGLIALPVLASTSEVGLGVALLTCAGWTAIAYIMMIVAAFKDGDTKWGIIGLCAWVPVIGWVCSLFFALYYCIFGSERGSWKLNYWCSFFAILAVVIVFATVHAETFEEMLAE